MAYKRISPIPVAEGGSGALTLTGVLTGNGTSAFTANTITQYGTVVAGASNAVSSIAPSATAGVPYISQGASSNPDFGTAVVGGGGTGNTTFTAYSVICAGTTATGAFQNVSGVGSAGQVLTSNGAAALPTWQAVAGGVTSVTGTANQVTCSPTTGAVIVSTPSTFIAPGTIASTTTTTAGTDLISTAGNLKLPTTSSSVGQIQINSTRYFHNFGTNNLFIGSAAGNFTLSASGNLCIGTNSGAALTSQGFNTCIGQDSGDVLTSGNENTFLGKDSGGNITTGHHNIILGNNTDSFTTTTTSSNIIIASRPGATNPAPADNTIRIGIQGTGDGQQNKCYVAGIYNTAVGATAGIVLVDNTTNAGQLGGLNGSANTFLVGGTKPSFTANPTASGTITGNALASTTTVTAGTNLVSTAGNLLLPTTSSSVGQIQINTTRWAHAYGTDSVWIGNNAGSFTLTGTNNIGIGTSVLANSGFTGSNSVAIGYEAGNGMIAGTNNVLVGYRAGKVSSSNGNCNQNVLIGYNVCNQAGSNTTDNVYIGYNAGASLTNRPFQSVVIGSEAHDVAAGTNNASNVLIGYRAGHAYTGGESSNILLGYNLGTVGDNNTTRIGNGTGTGNGQQNKCYISGIYGITTTSSTTSAVLVSDGDQLGTISSSARFKENIYDMAHASAPLMELRPVTFSWKKDQNHSIQYGLIAEEVAEIMPEIVNYDDEGKPFAVRYHDLPVMLLNEIQKLLQRIEVLEKRLGE